jgi:hypothetical protein
MLNAAKLLQYNRVAKRHGQRLPCDAAKADIQVSLNIPFWHRISKAEEDPQFYGNDALHMNPLGKSTLVKSWASDVPSLSQSY